MVMFWGGVCVFFTTWLRKGIWKLVHWSWSTELQTWIVQWNIEYFGNGRNTVVCVKSAMCKELQMMGGVIWR